MVRVSNDGTVTLRIEDYGLIGDTHTAALVGRDGSIDWMCLPRFDSAACFAHLLGDTDQGFWRIAPAASPPPGKGEPILATRRQYIADTLVLQSDFDLAEGSVRLTDCMPIREDTPVRRQARRVPERCRGHADGPGDPFRVRVESSPGCARIDGQLVAIAGPDGLALWTTADTHGEDMRTVSEFHLREGQQVPFVLTYFPSHGEVARPVAAPYTIEETKRWWQEWADLANFEPHRWRDAVVRSLITLKALTYEPTGGILAAPTTSLPETLGGERNWDYRYCWLRDATLTLVRAHGGGLPRRGGCMARLAVARGRGRPVEASDHVRGRRGEEPQGGRPRLASRLRGFAGRCASATRPRASTSSTSTARSSARCTRHGGPASTRRGRLGTSSLP